MEVNTIATKPILICQVCGDTARGVNFQVISCMSCKAFFRRHALDKSKTRRCDLDGSCQMSRLMRKGCFACRLQKCLAVGMNSDLIRRIPPKQSVLIRTRSKPKTQQDEQCCVAQPTTISLLSNDRSTLTINEWNLLSNIVHAYDTENLIDRTNLVIKQESALPAKMRFKAPITLGIVGSFYSGVQSFVEHCPYFHSLPFDARHLLIQHNLPGLGTLNAAFVLRETKLLSISGFVSTCNVLYGPHIALNTDEIIQKLEQNGTLIKMLFFILTFSTNCSIVMPGSSNYTITNMTSEMALIDVQNMFVTMMWKYLIYQYGFKEAVHRLDFLVRIFLQILKQNAKDLVVEHKDMVDEIVDQTERLLIVDS